MKGEPEIRPMPEFCIRHFMSLSNKWIRILVDIGIISAVSRIPGYENCETVEIVAETGTRETTKAYIRLL
jgi:hypothetical protein